MQRHSIVNYSRSTQKRYVTVLFLQNIIAPLLTGRVAHSRDRGEGKEVVHIQGRAIGRAIGGENNKNQKVFQGIHRQSSEKGRKIEEGASAVVRRLVFNVCGITIHV